MFNYIEKVVEKKVFVFVFSNDMGKFIWLNMKKLIFLNEWNFYNVNCNIFLINFFSRLLKWL